MKLKTEVRWQPFQELRADDEQERLVGYAAVFNSWSENLGGFRERLAPGAFKKTLQERPDVRALMNHDPAQVLGRVKNGTLALEEDPQGLLMELTLPDTSYGRDLLELVRRGDIDGMSFGFRVVRDNWEMLDSMLSRTVQEVELIEVSAVTFPAYPETQLSARGLHWPGEKEDLRAYLEGIGRDPEDVMSLMEPPAPAEDHAGRPVDVALRQLLTRGVK